jgi:hypothetical protein
MLASGHAFTRRCCSGCRTWGRSIGSGRQSTVRACRLPGGRSNRRGLPLAVTISPSNVHDSQMLKATVDTIPPLRLPHRQQGRPRNRPTKLHADTGYDYPRCRGALPAQGIIPRIARRGIEPWRASRTVSVGGGADALLAQSLSPPQSVLRTTRRPPSGVPFARLCAHLLVGPQPIRLV